MTGRCGVAEPFSRTVHNVREERNRGSLVFGTIAGLCGCMQRAHRPRGRAVSGGGLPECVGHVLPATWLILLLRHSRGKEACRPQNRPPLRVAGRSARGPDDGLLRHTPRAPGMCRQHSALSTNSARTGDGGHRGR